VVEADFREAGLPIGAGLSAGRCFGGADAFGTFAGAGSRCAGNVAATIGSQSVFESASLVRTEGTAFASTTGV
jgi:hypothetical protein